MPRKNRLEPKETYSVIPEELRRVASSSEVTSLKILGFSLIVEVGFMDGTALNFEKDLKLLDLHLERFESIYDHNR